MAQALSNLPIGAKIKFGKYSVNGEVAQSIVWLVVAKNHSSTPSYPTNSITLLTEKIIDLRAIDGWEPNNSDSSRASYGNNRYSLSNIDQWLNKDGSAGSWYSAQHSADHEPTSSVMLFTSNSYSTRPAFLNAFTTREKNAILNTTIRVAKASIDGGAYEDVSRQVFLASAAEVGISIVSGINEGARWSYFNTESRRVSLTQQAFSYPTSSSKPSVATDAWAWWLRTPVSGDSGSTFCVMKDGEVSSAVACNGSNGIRPALNLSSALSISDNTDSDGCYTIVWNSAPNSPAVLTVPTIHGGKPHAISWGSATDPDGDVVTYQLECAIDGGTYTQIYSGASTNYAHLVPFGTTSVVYRVRATDTQGASSEYTTSPACMVINNNAPVISGSDANLGIKSEGFTGTYTIIDADSDAVTVTESIDGVQIRSLVANLGQGITYGVTENTWLALPNGSHTLTIRATDGIDSTVRTYTFTKLVESFTIQNSTPWVSSTMPSRIMLVITRNIPSTATFKVEVCNNGYDAYPAWEDCTDAVKSGLVHVFANASKTATNWGVVIRVTVERNGATGACYVSAIGGNFE